MVRSSFRSLPFGLALCALVFCCWTNVVSAEETLLTCDQLPHEQFYCDLPPYDDDTQEISGCQSTNTVEVTCYALEQINCLGNKTFAADYPCRYTNGYSHRTALALSIFTGVFGIDRFYLGYPTIGLLKFFTSGFFVFGNIIDIVLIATQQVGPSDGSSYVVDRFGSRTKPASHRGIYVQNE
eukprot:TRINITY_DN2992_c0_g1_i1.p1 TRINITY_DN2992_c0_g1~~TRINITY_DN2992_c0_g1_i1.p1  ORF type:complete len:182 (+),score=31.64 TRINITY_DN2992_c0_g1_i1:63-608(+)